jgi:hypothetical protein
MGRALLIFLVALLGAGIAARVSRADRRSDNALSAGALTGIAMTAGLAFVLASKSV